MISCIRRFFPLISALMVVLAATACSTPGAQNPTALPSPPVATALVALPTGGTVSATPVPAQPTSTAVPSATTAPTPMPTATERPASQPTATSPPATQTASGFSGASAYGFDRVLSGEIGSRPGGSAAFGRAADYIEHQFEEMGYRVTLQPYNVSTFHEKSTRFSVTRPQRSEVTASALTYSVAADVSAQLLYAGLGRPEDYPPLGVQGKIVLLDRGEITFQNKVDEATARGAIAVVIANNGAGDLRGSLSHPSKIPVAGIVQSDGQRLRDLTRRGTTEVTLKVDATTETREGNNVVATPADLSNDRKGVIVGAHYDSVSAGPGANDNGSGVATMLELARVTRNRDYPFALTFVAFGDEEIGLVGSKRFVEGLSPKDRSQLLAMLNLDMVGVGTAMEFGGDQSLAAEATRIARSLGYRTQPISLQDNQSSDHVSFTEAGIPSVFLYRSDDPNYHTRLDTVDRVQSANLEAAGAVALRLLDMLAGR